MRLSICHRCRRLTTVCRCKPVTQRKRSSTADGYDNWWRKYSEWYREVHPYCVGCAAAGRPAVLVDVVDHIEPFHRVDGSIDERLRRSPQNHQGLCHGCHNGPKKRIEMKHEGNGPRIRRAWQMYLDAAGASE